MLFPRCPPEVAWTLKVRIPSNSSLNWRWLECVVGLFAEQDGGEGGSRTATRTWTLLKKQKEEDAGSDRRGKQEGKGVGENGAQCRMQNADCRLRHAELNADRWDWGDQEANAAAD